MGITHCLTILIGELLLPFFGGFGIYLQHACVCMSVIALVFSHCILCCVLLLYTYIQMCKLYFCRTVPEIQCQVAILSRATALLVLSQTGANLVHHPSSQVMVICSLEPILGHHHNTVHLSNLMVPILQHLVAIRLDGISLKTSNLIQLPLVLGTTIITSSSNLNNSLPLGLMRLLMLLATIMASLLHILRKDMILPTLSRVVGSKHMITLVTRLKGSSRAILSRLVMISRAMVRLLMDQLQTQPRMGLHPVMVVLVGLVRHPQGSKLQLQLLEATLVMPANLLPVLHQATQHKVLLHHLATALHRRSLAMAPSHHSKVVMVKVLMGSLLRRARSLLHLHHMGRLRLLDLRKVVMDSMVTANLVMVRLRHTLVHPLQATRAMRSSSLMVMLMAVEVMVSLQHTLLKQQLLHPRINLLHLAPLVLPQHLLLLLLTVAAHKHPQKVKHQWLVKEQKIFQASAVVSSSVALCSASSLGKRLHIYELYGFPCCFC